MPVAAEAPSVAARVTNEMNTVAVVRAAKRPRITVNRGCGVDRTSSSWVTANAMRSTGRKKNSAPRIAALVAVSLPLNFSRPSSSAEPCMSDLSWLSVCCTTTTIQAAKPAMASVHQNVGTTAMARPRA